MRVVITCEECGTRHQLERSVAEAGPIWIICHYCELPLATRLDATAFAEQVPQPTLDAWTGIFDLNPAHR